MGRPSKLTPQARERIVAALETGNFRETAARYAGVDVATFYRWIDRGIAAEQAAVEHEDAERRHLVAEAKKRGIKVPARATRATLVELLEEPERPYREFRDAVEKALADAEVTSLARIEQAASKGAWKAAAWRLERMHPDRWGRRVHQEVSGPGGQPIDVRLSHLTDDELDEHLERIAGVLATKRAGA